MNALGRLACRSLLTAIWFAAVLADCRFGWSADGWADLRVAAPFVCRGDASLDGVEGLLGELAQLQADLVRTLNVPPSDAWIELYLFRDQGAYRRYLRDHFPELPYRRALYVKRNGPGIVLAYRSKELGVDLRHECVHALLHAVQPMVPLWLDEGLAEYFEVPAAERVYGNSYLQGVRWKARLGMTPHLERLEKMRAFEEMGGDEYRDAWAWVHFLLHGPPEAGEVLRAFLADIRAYTPPGILSERLKGQIPAVEQRFAAHFRKWNR